MALAKILQALLLCGIATLNYGYNNNNCGIPLELIRKGMFGRLQFNHEAIEDVTTETTFFSFGVPSNVSDIESDRYGDSKYMKAEVEGELPNQRKLVIKPTEAFHRLEYELSSREEPVELTLDLEFTCGDSYGDSTAFTFVQPIIDTNNNAPLLNRKQYVYHFGMPIREGADLTHLMEIYAVDVDVTNTELEFTIEENDDIQIKYVKSDYSTGKIHHARLVTKRELATRTKVTYAIKATDNGSPQKSGTASVEIIID